MQLIRGLSQLKNIQSGCAATIGNFDGMHLGHQHILRCVTSQAKQMALPAAVILFEPQPQEYFSSKPPARLMTLRDKLQFLKTANIDLVLCLKFNQQLAGLNAAQFVTEILVNRLKLRWLMVGEDFRFGYQKQGDIHLLREAGKQYEFTLENSETILIDGLRVSSSRVRSALALGNLSLAKQLLGRLYSITGRVIYGDQRGRQLGFPTANLALKRPVAPLGGVFVVQINGISATPLNGIANIGTRPTVDGFKRFLEVHIFDFTETIYGQFLEIDFLCKIRDEKRFNSLAELTQQIELDKKTALEWLLKNS